MRCDCWGHRLNRKLWTVTIWLYLIGVPAVYLIRWLNG